MSKSKNTIEELRNKLFEKKKEEVISENKALIVENLPIVTYDIIQNPQVKRREFIAVEIRYNLDTKSAKVTEISVFDNDMVGLSIQLEKDNLAYLLRKNKK